MTFEELTKFMERYFEEIQKLNVKFGCEYFQKVWLKAMMPK